MPNEIFYRQCQLTRRNQRQTTWLPERFAIPGSVLKLKDNGEWSDGWEVTWASASKIAERLLPDTHKLLKERKAR
jgi:hypothetical protein